jgi:ketosteroid isomerase-like protein
VGSVGRKRVGEWLRGYEDAWRSPGTGKLAELFTDDSAYTPGPYERTRTGLGEIAELWDAEREGPDEIFTMTSEIVAVDGDTAVARIEVSYGAPVRREYRDLWVMRFAEDGRCRAFEEWPFWPEQPIAAPRL